MEPNDVYLFILAVYSDCYSLFFFGFTAYDPSFIIIESNRIHFFSHKK